MKPQGLNITFYQGPESYRPALTISRRGLQMNAQNAKSAACRVSSWGGDRSTEKGRCTRKSAQYSRTVCKTVRKRAAAELLWYTKASVHSHQVLTCFLALIRLQYTHPCKQLLRADHSRHMAQLTAKFARSRLVELSPQPDHLYTSVLEWDRKLSSYQCKSHVVGT